MANATFCVSNRKATGRAVALDGVARAARSTHGGTLPAERARMMRMSGGLEVREFTRAGADTSRCATQRTASARAVRPRPFSLAYDLRLSRRARTSAVALARVSATCEPSPPNSLSHGSSHLASRHWPCQEDALCHARTSSSSVGLGNNTRHSCGWKRHRGCAGVSGCLRRLVVVLAARHEAHMQWTPKMVAGQSNFGPSAPPTWAHWAPDCRCSTTLARRQ